MADQLKALPCPICNGAGESGTDRHNGVKFAGCADVDCIAYRIAYDFATIDAAIAAWNTRAEPVGVPTVQAGDGWKLASNALPVAGSLIAKKWKNGAVWAGIYLGSAKDSSFDEWCYLPSAAPSQPVAGKELTDEQIDAEWKLVSESSPELHPTTRQIARRVIRSLIFGKKFADADVLTTANAGKDAK